jgi:hypothetical protein
METLYFSEAAFTKILVEKFMKRYLEDCLNLGGGEFN